MTLYFSDPIYLDQIHLNCLHVGPPDLGPCLSQHDIIVKPESVVSGQQTPRLFPFCNETVPSIEVLRVRQPY